MKIDFAIARHISRLKSLGYDEYSMDSPNTQGRFFEAVQKSYASAVQAVMVQPLLQQFSVPLIGFFDERKDILDRCVRQDYIKCWPLNEI